jgi:signal transduction histidine kinase
MEGAVSPLTSASGIQTTPEIEEKKGGAFTRWPLTGGRTSGIRSYSTWPVFSLALILLLGLMLVPAVTALRRSQGIYAEIRATQEQFQRTQRVFQALSQNVFTISITIREFLLDNSPDAGRTYRSRLNTARTQLQTNIGRLRQALPPAGSAVSQKLEQEVDAYLALVLSVFDWTPRQRLERGAYFLREEQRPRRESILAVAEKLSELSTSVYAEQQRRTTDSEDRFRADLRQSVLFALLTGVVVSASGILRMRSLERRAREQHARSEQTTEEMRNLSVRLRHAQEDERRTISRELHDEVGQKLTAMRMELGTLERRRTDEREFDASLTDVKSMAEQSLRMIRDIAAGLRPSVLDDLGLGAAVQKQARDFSKRTGIPVSVSVEGVLDVLDDRHRTYIYRIVQEALTNCAKHAHARQIGIVLQRRDEEIGLTITDDGVGFVPMSVAHAGLGLIGIEERVRELGGIVTVQSSRGQGTTIRVAIPH